MFQHFIITRFNLPHINYKTDKNKVKVLTDEWLRFRLDLFKKYCFPSIANQTNQDFVWLAYFDSKSPQYLLDEIKYFSRVLPSFKPFFCDEIEEVKPALLIDIRSYLKSETTHIITTEIDNDDAINRNFVQLVQSKFKPSPLSCIDTINGVCMSIDPFFILSKYQLRGTPFISVIEEVTNFRTLIVRNHSHWVDTDFIEIHDENMWLQVIHSKNIINTLVVDKYITDISIIDDFSIKLSDCRFGKFYKMLVLRETVFLYIRRLIAFCKKIFKSYFPFLFRLIKRIADK